MSYHVTSFVVIARCGAFQDSWEKMGNRTGNGQARVCHRKAPHRVKPAAVPGASRGRRAELSHLGAWAGVFILPYSSGIGGSKFPSGNTHSQALRHRPQASSGRQVWLPVEAHWELASEGSSTTTGKGSVNWEVAPRLGEGPVWSPL